MLRTLFLIACLAFAVPAWAAAPAVDGSGAQGGSVTGNATLTVAVTNTAGNALYCGHYSSSTRTVSTFTYNSVAMTAVNSVANSEYTLVVYRLLAPDTGTHNVEVVLSGSANQDIVCVPLTGVNQTTPNGTTQVSAGIGSIAAPSIEIPAGGLGLDFVFNNDAGIAPDGSQSEIFDDFNNTNIGASTLSSTGSQVMSWTMTGTNYTAIVAVPLSGSTTTTLRQVGAIGIH